MKNSFKKASKKVEFSLSALQANPVQMKQLEGFIEEIALSKGKIKTEQDTIGDIRSEAKDNLGIPGKILMKLVREHISAGSIESEMSDLEMVQTLSQAIEGTTP
jgi:uncharacterized protein (UPF0335 family)